VKITEIRVKLADNTQERLLAFCTITLDDAFVVRDVKVIEGPKGPFVAMPSRKVTGRCPRCREKNHLRANYCNSCGEKVNHLRAVDDGRGRPRLYVDIAHPINQKCRTNIEDTVIEAFAAERGRSLLPGYVAQEIDDVLEFHSTERGGSDRRKAASNGSAPKTTVQGSGGEALQAE
jgi:stage V sporulation protein G